MLQEHPHALTVHPHALTVVFALVGNVDVGVGDRKVL